MNFIPNTQTELKNLNLKENSSYTIEYLNRDYFNGDENLEKTVAKAICDDKGDFSFIVTDDYGMEKFIKDVRVIL